MPVKNFHADLERVRPILPWSKIRVNDIDFTLVTNISTSEMYVDENKKYILKKLTTHGGGNCVRREAHILKILNSKGFGWAPELVYSKDEAMITKYIGGCVDKKNIPSDYKSQVKKILQNLRETGVEHNDISSEEILIKGGVIHLCDFGKGSINGDFLRDVCPIAPKALNKHPEETLIKILDGIYKQSR